MKFPKEQTPEVKKWVIERIENISDADPDVLAEYVLAILKSDVPDAEIRAQMLEHLPDFLSEHTLKFVDEVFAKYTTTPPTADAVTSTVLDSPGYSPPSSPIPIGVYRGQNTAQEARANDVGSKYTKKRSYYESNGHSDQPNVGHGASKSSKQGKGPRERNTLPRSQYPSPTFQPTAFHTQPFSNFPRPPMPPPGFPVFDPADPMSSFMAMQAMFPHMTGMSSTSHHSRGSSIRKRQRCQDYDTKGFCVRGSACPFDHGNDHMVASRSDEYDPTNAIIDTNGHYHATSNSQIRPGVGEINFWKPARAAFSDQRVPNDRSITSIVVEQIPEEYFNEKSVVSFFSQFGNISEVTMRAYKQLAIVKYDTRSAAQRAWQSPKVIFDNRFVKVYWYRPELEVKHKSNGMNLDAGPPFDVHTGVWPELVAVDEKEGYKRLQEEKQQAHERRQAALRKTEEAKQTLLRRKEEVTKQYEAETAVLRTKLALKGEQLPMNNTKEVSSEALALREQLARLEAEAEALGIDPNAPAEESSYNYRGRGTVRGHWLRGGYSRRGHGYAYYHPPRANYRGSRFVRGRSSAVRKLDNRPRKIAVSGVVFDALKEEMLRAYLVSVGEFESIERDSEKSDTFLISFRERWQAELVMNGQTDVPGVGRVKIAWVASASQATTQKATRDHEDEAMVEAPNSQSHVMDDDAPHELEVNLDVAEGDDEWENMS